jgi:putative chitinase
MSRTLDLIKSIAPKATVNIGVIADTIDKYGPSFNLNSDKRLQAFIAQAAHETDHFRSLKEYASGSAYEGRLDLGNTEPGDGKLFKGRGIFMYTGRTNYKAVSKKMYNDERLLYHPELLEQPEAATLSALHYWNDRLYKGKHLYQYADNGDLESVTKGINGGLNGWKDRLNYFEKAKIFFSTARR